MPASEVSEQISLAGTEASGTGNMKFMLNGAVTLGTLDGANVEIADAAGHENEIIFGMLTPEVNALKGMGYHPQAYISDDNIAMAVLDLLERGWDGENFTEVTNNLRNSDPYMVMADFKDYRRAQQTVQKLYSDRETWKPTVERCVGATPRALSLPFQHGPDRRNPPAPFGAGPCLRRFLRTETLNYRKGNFRMPHTFFNSRLPRYQNAVRGHRGRHVRSRCAWTCRAALAMWTPHLVLTKDREDPVHYRMEYTGQSDGVNHFAGHGHAPPPPGSTFTILTCIPISARSASGPGAEGRLTWVLEDSWQLTVYEPDFQTPDWIKSGTMYQDLPRPLL